MSRPSLVRLGALALLWGSGFFWLKLALHGLNPLQIVLGRLVAGAAVMLAVVAVGRYSLPRKPAQWAHVTVMAVVANIAPYFLFGWGVERIASGLAGVLNATTPLFTLAFALAIRSERLSAVRLTGLLLGFAGVVVLAAPYVLYKRAAFEHPEETPVAFSLDLAAKDLDLALDLAAQAGATMEQAATNRRVVGAAVAAGLGDHDLSALATFLRGAAWD